METGIATILVTSTEGFSRFDADWHFVELNAEAERQLGRSRSDLLGKALWDEYPAIDGTPFGDACRRVASDRESLEVENFYPPWGRWFAVKLHPATNGGVAVFFKDISERKRTEALQAGQQRVLEMIATGAPLADVLPAVCRIIEAQEEGLLCSILLTDELGYHTGTGFGPSLPESFLRALEGIRIAPPYTGSCCKALDSGQEVVVPDIASDHRWSPLWREVNLQYGLRACRSIPVTGSDGTVLASAAVFRRGPGDPGPADKKLLGVATHLAGIAIERSRAAQALKASEQRYRTLFESIEEGFCVIEKVDGAPGTPLDFRYVVANPAFGRHTGVPDVVGQTIRQAFPRAADEWFEIYDAVLRTGEPVRLERDLATDGPVLEIYAFAFENEGRRSVAVLFKDITERKRAEERERRLLVEAATANAQFRAFFEQGALFAGILRSDGIVVESNRLALEACGYTRDEVVGKLFWDCPWWNRSLEVMFRIEAACRQAAAGEPFRAELPYFAADGSERVVDFILLPIKDEAGRVMFLAPTGTDITDRKRAEGKLRKSEERMRLLWDAAAVLLTTDEPDAMLRQLFARIAPPLKLDTYFNYMVNDARTSLRLASSMGISQEGARTMEEMAFGQSICGTIALLRKPIVASHIQQSDDPKAQAVKALGIRAYAGNPLIAGDELLGTLSFASRSRDEFGAEELDFLQTICHYVTAAYERLRLISKLKEGDRRKDEFLATLAHELRNPLAPLRNGLEVMRLGKGDGESFERARTMMERQLAQMVHLVDDLLDVSRISRGKIALRVEHVELGKVVQQAVETSRPLIDSNQQELRIELPPQPTIVSGDVTRLAQIVSNLLNNAAKYTPRHGCITLTVGQQGSDAVLRVRDTGIGIPSDMLPNIFDMFTQVDRSLERSQGGLGIGLSLVDGLVRMHGGSVTAASGGPGRGSEFIVRLPLAQAVIAPEPSEAGHGRPAAQIRRRILVVDDNQDAAHSLALLLQVMGNEAQMAHDGLEALDVAAAFKPDLVMLDIGMPRLNGYDTARRIREQPWGKDLVLVALTGWGQKDDKRKSRDAGFDSHMTKPADPAALEKLLAGLPAAGRT